MQLSGWIHQNRNLMKKIILSIFVFLILPIGAFAQTIDWVNEYYIYGYSGKQFTGLTKDSLGNIFLSGNGYGYGSAPVGSNFYKLDSNGDILFSDTASGDKWNSMQIFDNSVYTMGTEFIKRDLNGNILFDQNLIRIGSSYLRANDAKIIGGFLYAIQFGDLIKYDLLGKYHSAKPHLV